ncbi:MAG: patatin-like phospholipase family protein [Actinobacteria bacterium]|nr:patatin-like phospholipase family protein [Actinomycetota bacterium]MCB8998279.1 patatin-like phospholipase family protein [Actinomycetota bacterium]MCB9415543.1 patatin-like phospholipase family protein [Actinomycetota bacterium]HRY11170.1 patatin-like phospholipase family protein [Candidatus Nanopelagicales bacterium]
MAVSPFGALVAAARVTVTQRSAEPIFERELLAGSGEVVVLSGGAALGSAQVGMLEALAAAGVKPALLLGTSAGAINASFFASDPTLRGVRNLADIWMELTTRKVFGTTTHRAANLLRGRSGLSSPQGLREVIAENLPYYRIEDAPTPVGVVTTHLRTGTAVLHRSGSAVEILLASAAIPGVFPPVRLSPMSAPTRPGTHVDGGVRCMVPVEMALAQRPKRVWVLDVASAVKATRSYHPGSLDPVATGFAMALAAQADATEEAEHDTHVRVINLPMGAVRRLRSAMDFSRGKALYDAGRDEAERVLASVL